MSCCEKVAKQWKIILPSSHTAHLQPLQLLVHHHHISLRKLKTGPRQFCTHNTHVISILCLSSSHVCFNENNVIHVDNNIGSFWPPPVPSCGRALHQRTSVTRFGEVSTLWRNFQNLWPFFLGSTFAKFLTYLGTFLLLGKFWLLQMAKLWKISLALWSHYRGRSLTS